MAEDKRTQFAMQALGFAELFAIRVGSQKLEGPVTFRVELAAPEGPSTGGGKQSMQHVRLVPEAGGPVTVPGWADPIARRAELRSYEYLSALHAQRFKGAPLPIDRAQYETLMARMDAFFREAGLTVSYAALPTAPTAPMTAEKPSSNLVLILAIVAVVAVIVGVVAFLLLRARG
jgi:hypothetical protein